MDSRNRDSCPVCGELKVEDLFPVTITSSEFRLVRCENCYLTRIFPFPTTSNFTVNEIPDYYGIGVSKFLPVLQKIRNRIARSRAKYYLSFIPGSIQRPKVLDVGCAEGRLLNALFGLACECWGIEHPSYPSGRFLHPEQINYWQGDLCTFPVQDGYYDLIFLWHVLEHLDDPKLVIARLYRLLGPGGTLILAVPNFSSLESRKFKGAWFHLDIPWHRYHFDRRSLGYLLDKNQFKIIRESSFCFEQGPYGFLQSILNAMGWKMNELYDVLKGGKKEGRAIHLGLQLLIAITLCLPVTFASFLSAKQGRGSVLKLIIKKVIPQE